MERLQDVEVDRTTAEVTLRRAVSIVREAQGAAVRAERAAQHAKVHENAAELQFDVLADVVQRVCRRAGVRLPHVLATRPHIFAKPDLIRGENLELEDFVEQPCSCPVDCNIAEEGGNQSASPLPPVPANVLEQGARLRRFIVAATCTAAAVGAVSWWRCRKSP